MGANWLLAQAGLEPTDEPLGFTREYPLHLLTRRLWGWRDEFGSESEWAIALGRVLAPSGSALWSEIPRSERDGPVFLSSPSWTCR